MPTDHERPILTGFIGVAVLMSTFLSPAALAQGPGIKPVKLNERLAQDPLAQAQIEIARLRQTADQLRVLALRPVVNDLSVEQRAELARHEQWLRAAETRLITLADHWESRLKPLRTGANIRRGEEGRLADVNSFYRIQTQGLQATLQRESTASGFSSEPVKAAHETAKVVIGNLR